MRVFKTRVFSKLSRDLNLDDEALANAAREMFTGLTGNPLGGNLYKKRVARPGAGKRGGFRTIVVYRKSQRQLYFVYCFQKNQKESLTPEELVALKLLEKHFSQMTAADINRALIETELTELEYEDG